MLLPINNLYGVWLELFLLCTPLIEYHLLGSIQITLASIGSGLIILAVVLVAGTVPAFLQAISSYGALLRLLYNDH